MFSFLYHEFFLELKMQMFMTGVSAYLEWFIIYTKKNCGN